MHQQGWLPFSSGRPDPVWDLPVNDPDRQRGFVDYVRAVGRVNLDELRAVRDHLHAEGIADRSLVRILDALLWVSSPGSGLFSSLTGWERVFRPRPD
jgi:hypothetical protein